MKRPNLPGMIKYGSVKEALMDISKKTEDHHKKFVKDFQEGIDAGRKQIKKSATENNPFFKGTHR